MSVGLSWFMLEQLLLYVALVVAPVAFYLLIRNYFLSETADHRRRAYSEPDGWKEGITSDIFDADIDKDYFVSMVGWNFPIKRAWAAFCLWRQGPLPPFLPQKEATAGIPSETEFRVEKPKKILRDKVMDTMSYYGVDSKGNWLVLCIVRKFHRQSEVWLHLGLADGTVYQLVDHPDTTIPTTHMNDFQAGGLRFTQIEPMRIWRITFNGTLRRGVLNEWKALQNEDELIHVRLNFIWIACSDVSDARASWSTELLSEALAKEPWRSGNWLSIVCLEPPGYDQFGVMNGIVRVGESDLGTKLYLRGGRVRRWGEVQEESLERAIHLQGVAENGCFFSLRTTCRQDGLTRAVWGIVRLPSSMVIPVTACDLDLPQIAHEKNIPRQLVIRFSAGGRNFILSLQFQEKQAATLYSSHPWRLQTLLRKFQFGMNGVRGNGIAEFTYKYRGRCPVPPVPVVGQLALSPRETKDGLHPLVCDITDHVAQIEALTGGKGASLSLLSTVYEQGFQVPAGFCVTTVAYVKQLMSSSLLQASILNIKEVSTGQIDGDLKTACEKAMKAFEEAEIHKEIKTSIEKFLKNFTSDTVVFAIRSSAVGEDSEDLSCAGQNLTLLGVKASDVTSAVCRCWGSLFSEHSVQYRRQNGQPLDPWMAVVVQQMVPAENAGVMFTRHPFSGNPKQLVITANYGLGESVVSATAEPDTVVVSRTWNDLSLSVQEVTVGRKQESLVLGPDGEGTKSTVTLAHDQQRLCLNNEQLLTLARVGVLIEKLFGGARDIEWAIVKDELYLLQARPITALNSWTDYELEHEFDMAVPTDTEILTLANTGEVFPGALTPLTVSTVSRILDHCVELQCQRRHKYRKASGRFQTTTATISFHMMLNTLNTILSQCDEKITLTNKIMDIGIHGRIVTNASSHNLAVERYGVQDRLSKCLTVFNMIKDTFTARRVEKQSKRAIKHICLQAEQYTSSASLLAAIVDIFPHIFYACHSHGHMSRVSIFTEIAAMYVLAEGKEEWETDHYTDFSLILSSCSDVESVEIPTLLRDLAATIQEEDSDYFCSTSPSQALNWIQTESLAAGKFKSFLQNHGHRSMREFELHSKTWGMHPESLIEILQTLVKNPHPSLDNETSLSIAETCEILKCPTKKSTRRALRILLPFCRTAVGRRERSKSRFISVVHILRLGYRRLAQLLVKEGKLPDVDLMFYLSHYEISRLVHQHDTVLVAKATKRRRLWATWESLQFPETSFGMPIPMQEQEQEEPPEGLVSIKATPVCSGVVLGRACVITALSQTSSIMQGDILVTHSTDIGWTPYFPLLAGIATELGGLISHGAVVAREYGLPCIVGAFNATRCFKTGDIVRLNGGTGILEKISIEPLYV